MILISYGTRPEYIKLKSIFSEFDKEGIKYMTLFTGQHEDLLNEHTPTISLHIDSTNSTKVFNNRLNDIVSSILKSNIFNAFDVPITYVMVMGDTTSAMAVALSAFHHGIKVIHLEAGLRTYDNMNPYPEEINRRIISQIASIHLCPTKLNYQNLINEHVDTSDAYVVGNTVIDNLLSYKDKCEYTNKVLVTLHRRENHEIIREWFTVINNIAKRYPELEFILPIHPNPRVLVHKDVLTNVNVIKPLPYEEMLNLLVKTKLVITDSGGLQEECSFFNKRCLVCRKTTERPEAIGFSNVMIETPLLLSLFFDKYINDYNIDYFCPFGDGHAAENIVKILIKYEKSISSRR